MDIVTGYGADRRALWTRFGSAPQGNDQHPAWFKWHHFIDVSPTGLKLNGKSLTLGSKCEGRVADMR